MACTLFESLIHKEIRWILRKLCCNDMSSPFVPLQRGILSSLFEGGLRRVTTFFFVILLFLVDFVGFSMRKMYVIPHLRGHKKSNQPFQWFNFSPPKFLYLLQFQYQLKQHLHFAFQNGYHRREFQHRCRIYFLKWQFEAFRLYRELREFGL